MKLGQFDIQTFVEHRFKLDGGSMFGVIPRTFWQKTNPPDQNNLIEMVVNLFVLTAHGKNFIFDAGFGDTLTDKEKKIYNINSNSSMIKGLKSVGLSADDIDYVILTHLHTDHAAGAVELNEGKFIPRFKNAKYVVSRQEFEDATNPDERTAAVYIPERYHALRDSGQLELIDGDNQLFPGIRTVLTGGHTKGHFGIELESEGQKLFYYADIFCSTSHIPVAYIPATDLYPLESMEVKRKKLPEIIADNVILALDHDIHTPFVTVQEDGRRFKVTPVNEPVKAAS